MRYVIIGGGIAGTTAAEELRKADQDAEITIVSEEPHAIYSRVLLPHYIKGKIPRERVFLKKESWYGEHNIECLCGIYAQVLDVKNRFVGLSNGRELEYDKLLIATGGEVRTIDEDFRGVSYFRTLDDADHIIQLLAERLSTDRGFVYGGGFIACEFINIFRHFDMPTSVAFRGESFWSQIFERESGELVSQHLREHGVEVLARANSVKLVGNKELEAVRIGGKEISAKMCGIGIGLVPQFHWLKTAGIETGSGIRCNEFLETNAPDVFTAGDCTEFYDVVVGRHVHVGNWMNAMSQGRVVAKNMRGEKAMFKLVSSYATNVLGLEIIFVGDVDRTAADQVVVRGSVQDGGVTQLFVRDGRLVGATMVNRNTDRTPITKFIQSQEDVQDRLARWKSLENSIE